MSWGRAGWGPRPCGTPRCPSRVFATLCQPHDLLLLHWPIYHSTKAAFHTGRSHRAFFNRLSALEGCSQLIFLDVLCLSNYPPLFVAVSPVILVLCEQATIFFQPEGHGPTLFLVQSSVSVEDLSLTKCFLDFSKKGISSSFRSLFLCGFLWSFFFWTSKERWVSTEVTNHAGLVLFFLK